jgi:membrane associated rhomboid family serine protease
VIPIRDTIKSREYPLLNVTIILINTLAFFYQLSLGRGLDAFILHYGLVPATFTLSAKWDIDPLTRYLPFFTSMFLHGGWIHFLSNMWYLWIFGDNVEDRLGHVRYLIFYLLCGFMAGYIQYLIYPLSTIPMIGASGAIAGILGAYLALFPRSTVVTLVPIFIFLTLVEIPAVIFLVLWFFMQFLNGAIAITLVSQVTGGIAWWAHIGGFLTGFFLVHIFKKRQTSRYYEDESWPSW